MAIKHGNSRTLYTSNQSSACLGYCDPSCPYSCSDYFPPPPSSESSTLPQPAPSYSGGTSSNNHRFPPSIIFIIAFLGGTFLIVSYYVIISKSCLWYRSRRNGSPLNNSQSPSDESGGGGDDFHDGTRIDHPIWYIRTIGLSNAVINSITAVKYDKSNGLIEGTDCTVCLSEFREGETLRVLPKCNHAFHVKCIDTWLGSHVNCPLCRAHVIVSSRHSVFDENISSISRHSLEESQRNIDYSGNLSSREENQTEGTFVNNSNLVGSDVEARNDSGVLRMIPESVHDGRQTLLPEGNGGRDSKERFVGSNGFLGQVPSDVGRHILVDVEEMGLGRRSISMDSNSRISNSHVEEIRIDVEDGNPTISEVMENGSDPQPKSDDMNVSSDSGNSSHRNTSTPK